eukprot:CAMPEP_0169277650 /NCGR_PEP_ID=MMETSP1016-20121227/53829_1 /TAXON_ID=342587 /ORGANISM="Karlodinium micrum, Strain CCMP2283" /LENGTH=46 /DNA_ID= /DNA_START= /DNA_END= /DNA_ORIENTATION=
MTQETKTLKKCPSQNVATLILCSGYRSTFLLNFLSISAIVSERVKR